MSYYFSKTISAEFDETIAKVTDALKLMGFGIVSDIDMQSKFKDKLNVDYKRYRILGACNPSFAFKAIQAEEKIGTMLPCNVVVSELNENMTEVTAIDPIASMMAINNPALTPLATEISEKLKKLVESL
jgi:uncharacterized protein (DUF302 family)